MDFSYSARRLPPAGPAALSRARAADAAAAARGDRRAGRRRAIRMMAATDAAERLTFALQRTQGQSVSCGTSTSPTSRSATSTTARCRWCATTTRWSRPTCASAAFDRVFSLQPRTLEAESPRRLPLADAAGRWCTADATQTAAVALARSGASYIIQGPPGTGKSQTITNLIADYVGRGKRVLFVCEKRAAIDVVFHRLRQQGLDELCCLIHDSQADKKAFVQTSSRPTRHWLGERGRPRRRAAQAQGARSRHRARPAGAGALRRGHARGARSTWACTLRKLIASAGRAARARARRSTPLQRESPAGHSRPGARMRDLAHRLAAGAVRDRRRELVLAQHAFAHARGRADRPGSRRWRV